MKLLTKELTKKLIKAGSQNMQPICKFFSPIGSATWLITGLESDGDTLWGYADLGMQCVEFGTVFLSELQNLRLPFGLGIERDLHWEWDGKLDYCSRESLSGC